jgi:hypothetical protein
MVASNDRRFTSRRECLFGAAYRPSGAVEGYWPALVQDISTHGASMIVSRPVPVGTQLTLRLQRQDGEEPIQRDMDVRYVAPFGTTAWMVGGVFDTDLEPLECGSLR